jgi:multiple sugar transport system permease protein
MRTGRRVRLFFMAPALVALGVMAVYPAIFALGSSLVRWRLTRPDLGITFVGLDNYLRALDPSGPFLAAIARTLVFTLTVVTIEVVLGVAFALLLYRSAGRRSWAVVIIALPMMLTPVAIAYMWRYMFDSSNGVINFVLGSAGLGEPIWLQSVDPPWLSFVAVILVDVWQWTPFIFLLALAGLSGISDDLLDAARIDGAGGPALVRHLLVPLILPTLAVAVLIRAIGAFKEFDKVFILTGGGPGSTTELVSYRVYVTGLQQFDMGQTGAMGVLLLLVSVGLARVFVILAGYAAGGRKVA